LPEKNDSIVSSIEQKIIGTSYSLIGRKMLVSMKKLKYSEDLKKPENTDSEESENKFLIAGIKKGKYDEDPENENFYNGPIRAKIGFGGIGHEFEENEEENLMKKPDILRMNPDDYEEMEGKNIEFYDEEIQETINPSVKNKGKPSKNIIEGDFNIPYKDFDLFGSLQIKQTKYPLPEVPSEYDPFHRSKSAISENLPNASQIHSKMNPEKRAKMLGEKFLTNSDLGKKNEDRFVKPQNTDEFNENDIVIELPFPRESDKMQRFRAYVCEKKGQKVPGLTSFNVFLIFFVIFIKR